MSQLQKIKVKQESDQTLEAAKWLQIPLMLSLEEIQDLMDALSPFHIVKTLSKIEEGKAIIPMEDFIALYRDYAENLMQGEYPDPKRYKAIFSSVLTKDLDALYSIPMGNNFEVIKVKKPIVQMQYHTMTWSKEEKKFRSQLYGKDSFPWGIVFSYPQIILDPNTKEIIKADIPEFQNCELFKTIKLWQKENTTPTPFLLGEKKINASQRIGKKCLQWINNHAHLKDLELKVFTRETYAS